MSSARDDLGVTIRVPVARRPPAWTPPPADRARRGGSLPTLGVLPEQPEVDAAAVGVSWQMDDLQRPKHRLRHHPQAAAAAAQRLALGAAQLLAPGSGSR